MMHRISKEAIIPILIPQKMFHDRFGQINAYIDMNPSMHIDNDGNVKILIRRIDYQKFHNRQFILYNHYSNSLYALLCGKLNENEKLEIDAYTFQEIYYEYDLPTYNTYWKGPEDIRFIDSNTILATVPECNQNGNPSIFNATLDQNRFKKFIPCYPNNVEKNWMPYQDASNNTKVIYSLSPLRIKDVLNSEFYTIPTTEKDTIALKDYHGSTNGIEYELKRLFLIHVNHECTKHRWLLLDLNNNSIRLSKEFVFFNHTYIEFPVSLAKFKNRIFLSIGVNDNKAFIIELTMSEINKCFV